MSDTIIALIPTDPCFTPSAGNEAAVLRLVGELFPTSSVAIDRQEHVVFRDCGSNFESVICPGCGEDLTEPWAELMSADFDGEGFRLSPIPLPCCGAEHTLNDLKYEMPQGFSKYELRLAADVEEEVGEGHLAALSEKLGCEVRAILRHI